MGLYAFPCTSASKLNQQIRYCNSSISVICAKFSGGFRLTPAIYDYHKITFAIYIMLSFVYCNPHDNTLSHTKGLRPVLERFVVIMREGGCETGGQILTNCSHKPECIVTTNPDRSVIITFQFHPANVSILHLRYDYGAGSENRSAGYSHWYVTWSPLTTGIIA